MMKNHKISISVLFSNSLWQWGKMELYTFGTKRNRLSGMCFRPISSFSLLLFPYFLFIIFSFFSNNLFLIQLAQCQTPPPQSSVASSNSFVEIQTELGRIRGIQIRTYYNNPAISFLGIPYALSPIGNRRFKKPVPHPKWSPKTLVATNYQSCCPQIDINGLPHGEENCLFLNVFVPLQNIDQNHFSSSGKRFPVMIYIQGESFENGDAALYGAEHLLDWDVIVVTFNYRLGILGFFSTGDEHATGNWGLYDQLLVMKWVRDHIESFSGDPNQVTLFGQGSGASSAILHLISPLSTGLFNRVIAQSGSPLCSWSIENDPQDVALDLARRIGCSTRLGNSELVRCLRNVKLTTLLKAQQHGKIFGEYPHWFVPVIEDSGHYNERLVPEDPKLLISLGNYKRIPLMMGYNKDETSFLYPLILNRKLFGDSGSLRSYLEEKLLPRFIRATVIVDRNPGRGSSDFIRSNVFKFKSTHKDAERDIQQNILYKYFNFLNSKNYTDMAIRFINMSTDALYGSCIDETLRLYSAATSHTDLNPKNRINFLLPFANVTYKYVFGYRGRNSMLNLLSQNDDNLNQPSLSNYGRGASDLIFPSSSNEFSNHHQITNSMVCHGDELFYLFNVKFPSKKPQDNRDELTQRRILHLWTDFAKHGFTPFTPSLETPFWPSYTSAKPKTYIIDDRLYTVDSYRDMATHFWIRYLPSISSSPILASASIINKPVSTNGSWKPSSSSSEQHRNNYPNDRNSLGKLRTFAWSMLALCLILFMFVIILMLLLFYQRRRQSFSAATNYRPNEQLPHNQTTPKTLAQFFATKRTSVSGLY